MRTVGFDQMRPKERLALSRVSGEARRDITAEKLF
jgi:hypothetical protein